MEGEGWVDINVTLRDWAFSLPSDVSFDEKEIFFPIPFRSIFLYGSLVPISEVRGSSLALSTTIISLILYIFEIKKLMDVPSNSKLRV